MEKIDQRWKNITHKNTATSNKQCMKSVFRVCMCLELVPRRSDRRESKYSGTCVVKAVAKTGSVVLYRLVKKLPTLYGTRTFRTLFTKARHFSVSWYKCTQFAHCFLILLDLSDHYMYRTVVTICTTKFTFNNSTFWPQFAYVLCVVISLCSIKKLFFIKEKECVLWEVSSAP